MQKFLNSDALAGTDAVLSGSTDLSNAGGKMSASGSLKAENAVVHGVSVGYPITADFDVADNLNSDVIQHQEVCPEAGIDAAVRERNIQQPTCDPPSLT